MSNIDAGSMAYLSPIEPKWSREEIVNGMSVRDNITDPSRFILYATTLLCSTLVLRRPVERSSLPVLWVAL